MKTCRKSIGLWRGEVMFSMIMSILTYASSPFGYSIYVSAFLQRKCLHYCMFIDTCIDVFTEHMAISV